MKRLVLTAVLAAVACGSSCSQKIVPSQPEPDVLAEIGPCKIRVSDFVYEAERRAGGIDRINRDTLLEEMITHDTLVASALARGLDQDPEIRRAYHNLLAGRLRQLKLDPLLEQAQACEEEARRHYEANIERYRIPPRQRLAMLRVAVDRTMTAERRQQSWQRLEAAREKALADLSGEGFGVLAIQYSDHQASRYRGGEIGWIEQGREGSRWDPALMAAGAALAEPGQISPVIEGRDAFYVVRLLETQPESTVPFEQVAHTISHRLLADKHREIELSFLQRIRSTFPVRIHNEVLHTLPQGTGQTVAEPQPPSWP